MDGRQGPVAGSVRRWTVLTPILNLLSILSVIGGFSRISPFSCGFTGARCQGGALPMVCARYFARESWARNRRPQSLDQQVGLRARLLAGQRVEGAQIAFA